jgi:hypothetical protein
VFTTLVRQSYQAGKYVPSDFLLRRTETPNDFCSLVGDGAGQLTNPLVACLRQRPFSLRLP